MFDGIGNFTVDAQEPETLTITLSGVTAVGSPLNLEFDPAASAGAATGIAILGQRDWVMLTRDNLDEVFRCPNAWTPGVGRHYSAFERQIAAGVNERKRFLQ